MDLRPNTRRPIHKYGSRQDRLSTNLANPKKRNEQNRIQRISPIASRGRPCRVIRLAWPSLAVALAKPLGQLHLISLASLTLFLSRPHHTPLADPMFSQHALHDRIELSKPGTSLSLAENLVAKFGITEYKCRARHLQKGTSFFTP